jgi:hypothetical protein
MSKGTKGDAARKNLEVATGFKNSDLMDALMLAYNDEPIPVNVILENPVYRGVGEYLGVKPAVLFTALRFLSVATQLQFEMQQGIYIEQQRSRSQEI